MQGVVAHHHQSGSGSICSNRLTAFQLPAAQSSTARGNNDTSGPAEPEVFDLIMKQDRKLEKYLLGANKSVIRIMRVYCHPVVTAKN
ncbi:hypothetical protein PAMP_009113 [Pampus punctatissimus]